MKLKIKNIIGFLAITFLIASCDTNNEVTGYDPANYNYTSPEAFTLVETSATDNNFMVTYTPTAAGKGYYMMVPAGTAAPTSTKVHSGGGQQSGSFDVDASTPVAIDLNTGIYGGYAYDVYAIHKSTDNFISETVTKLGITTPDTSDPMFLRDDSSPAFTSAGISPFAPVTFTFDEPVFYQGGDITFSGFGSGRVITVSGDAVTGSGTTSITINSHGTFAEDDFQVITWGADTFKDNSGKSVAELSGFSHYFKTRLFTFEEKAMLMAGTYNYSTVWYGGLNGFYNGLNSGNPGAFLPETGEYEITADDTDALTLRGLNLFSGFNNIGLSGEAETLPIVLTADDWATGYQALGEMPASDSVITVGGEATQWLHYAGFFGPNPGGYSFDSGEIIQYVSLVYASDSFAIDDIDYIYTRIGTFSRGANNMDNLVRKSREIKAQDRSTATGGTNFSY